jgi:hypothetical protein
MKTARQLNILPASYQSCSDNPRRKKYFDYFVFKIVGCALPRSGLIVARSRKLSATLGGSTSTRPGVRKITLKIYDFIDISNATIPTALGGSTTTSPLIVDTILRQQLDYVIIDYGRADRGAPDKS